MSPTRRHRVKFEDPGWRCVQCDQPFTDWPPDSEPCPERNHGHREATATAHVNGPDIISSPCPRCNDTGTERLGGFESMERPCSCGSWMAR